MRKRPLLVLFLVQQRSRQDLPACRLTGPAFSLAVCLPTTKQQVREQTYQINKVLRDQILKESEDNADDDETDIGEDG